MFNKYCITAISYSIFRNMYYCKNIHITEIRKDNTKINRPLLLGEVIASIGFGVISAVPLFPFSIINDIIYIERKQKKLCLNEDTYIPYSIYIGCTMTHEKHKIIHD